MVKTLCFVVIIFLSFRSVAQEYSFLLCDTHTDASFRGLSVIDDSVAWVSGSKGWVGKSRNGGRSWEISRVKGYEKCDFRSLYAFDENNALIANAGSPAYILRTTDGGVIWDKVYENNDTAAFFDGIDFRDKKTGIIYGDPIAGKMLMLTTTDGGIHWQTLPETPLLSEGEASFAASGTNIHCYGQASIFIATGGNVSRLFYSDNNGMSWNVIPTPILQTSASTGIFSFSFASNKDGIIVGGDYKNDTLKKDHVFYTNDGGKHWRAPLKTTGGYRECVLFTNKTMAIATGPGGTDISYDKGLHWVSLSGQGYHVIKKARNGSLMVAGGSNGKLSLLRHR